MESEPPSAKVESLLHQGKQMQWLGLAELRSIATSNTTLAIVDQAVVSGTRFLTTIFIGRLCGKEELGVYTLMFAVYLVFACLQESLAAAPYVVFGNRLKGASRHAFAGSVLLQSLVIGMTATLIVGGGSMMVWSGYGPAELAPTSLALAVVLPFMLLWQLARNIAIAHLKLVHALTLDVATATLQVAGVAWLAWRSELTSAGGYLALGAGCACTGLAWLFLFRHKLRFRRSQIASDWRKNWVFGRWVLASQIVGTLHGYMPAWVLVVAMGTAATGVFSACESIVLLSNPLILAIANLYGATTARAYASGGYSAVRQTIWLAKTQRPNTQFLRQSEASCDRRNRNLCLNRKTQANPVQAQPAPKAR